jgi:hypothetical protein
MVERGMLGLDVQLKFWELLFGLVGAGVVVVGVIAVVVSIKRRTARPALYVEAGGVVLSVGEERLLEKIARASGQDSHLFSLAQALNADQIAVYAVARELKHKDLIVEVADLSAGSPRFELSPTGHEAALARNYIKLVL